MDALPNLEELCIEQLPHYDTKRRIRVLVARGAAITIPAMEAVIIRCLKVEVLKFIQAVGYIRATGEIDNRIQVDIWPYLRKYCNELHEVHFSRIDTNMTMLELDATASSLPHFPESAIIPTVEYKGDDMDKIFALSNTRQSTLRSSNPSCLTITHKELHPILDYIREFRGAWLTGLKLERISDWNVTSFSNILHRILCSCPNLIIFAALSVNYYLEDMDVNNLLSSGGGYRTENEPIRKSEHCNWRSQEAFHETEEELPTTPRRVWSVLDWKNFI
ncbi:hypothetical protein FBU30_007086 [Linnemannia zychae]|nr:hypothetical protein FBU30_007086 [Linnemannia zychae]